MSTYHIRAQDKKGKTVDVVYHIPVPAAGTNQAGVSWRTAVVSEAGGSSAINSVIPVVVGTAEETSMKSGAIIEQVETVRFSSINLSNAQKQAEIEAKYTALSSELISEKQQTLAWMDFEGDV